ncbi:MAG: prolyl oligopeptidase family serine peptidase [Usitatibacter sp.]
MTPAFPRAILSATILAFSLGAFAQQKASEIPVETFQKRPENQAMVLSPNGELLAALTPLKGRDNLVVVDLNKRSRTIITSFSDYDVVDFRWVGNKRLFFRVADGRDALGRAEFAGTYAIDADGGDQRDLSRLVFGATPTYMERRPSIVPLRHKDGDEMYVEMNQRRRDALDVFVLNTRTGRYQLLTQEAPADTLQWILDWDGVPRVALATDPTVPKDILWYRDDDKSPWQKLMEWEAGIDSVDSIVPLAFDEDNKNLYVSSNVGRDRAAIFKYDPRAKKLGEVVFEHPLVDLTRGLIFDRKTHKLEGIRYNADKPGIAWVNEDMAKLQKQVDASLPGMINYLTRSEENSKRLLIFSQSDVDSGRYYLLNREPLGMEELMATRPWLKPELMSPVKYMPYNARDGLQIPAWVTIPKDSAGKNLPLVVHVHGGPWLRVYGWTSWTRYAENQFFASRGYVVLEAEPRASGGFGKKLLSAGYKQFGQAMQDDLTDGVMELVKQGIVDRNKVCIYGGSYGGYASLWGVIKDPDLYRCAVPWVALTDLALWQTATWTDFAQNRRYNYQPQFDKQVGSARTEKEFLDKYSPYLHADRIKVPVLLAMGEDDRRVPIDHGSKMKSALITAGVKYDYVIYPREGHGFNKDENVFDFFKRVEKFLAENLK